MPSTFSLTDSHVSPILQQHKRKYLRQYRQLLIGVPHEVFTDGIIAFVEKSPIVDIILAELEAVVSEMAAYKRPSHFGIIEPGTLPLNRVAKTDYVVLKEKAAKIAQRLRAGGKWDA